MARRAALSIPNLSWDCRRRRHVIATGLNLWGEPVTVTGSDLLARSVQHEIDHLDGVLFIDRLDTAMRERALAEIAATDWAGPTPVAKVSPYPSRGQPQ
jgi:peptide deformylase